MAGPSSIPYEFGGSQPLVEAPEGCTGVLTIIPAYGQNVSAHTMSMTYGIGQLLTQSKIQNQMLWFSMADIIEARNVFLTLWYDHFPQMSHLLMIDSDMNVNPSIIRDMILLDEPVSGVFYRKRELTAFEQWAAQSEPVRTRIPMPNDGETFNSVMIGHPLPGMNCEVRGGQFMKCRHVGGGVMMIQRKAINKMLAKMPELMDFSDIGALGRCGVTRVIRAFEKILDPVNKNILSEDYAFCERWQQCGGDVWANVHYEVNHIGPYNFKHRYLDYLKLEERKTNG